MTIAIMQPYLFPYLGYYQLVNRVDKFIIYDDVNFINKGWINRNHILVNGQRNLFTVPLQNPSQNEIIKDVLISYNANWEDKLLKKIAHSYKKAAFFDTVFPLVQSIIKSDCVSISELSTLSIRKIAAYLNISTPIIPSSVIYNNQQLKAQERIVDICGQNTASIYVNPIGGQALYQEELFKKNGLQLLFHKAVDKPYKQFGADFIPWLSILDVLMFNSIAEIKALLQNYDLINSENQANT